jgi:CRISPR-associated protein Csh1
VINDIYLRFKELYLKTNGKILIQNFRLENEPCVCIKVNDNGKVLDKLIILDDFVKKDELYDWFAIRNIKSKYLNSNKAVGSKMIFSSNNYSLFGRIDTFPLITYESFVKLFKVKKDKNNKKTTQKSEFYSKYEKKIEILFQKLSQPVLLQDLLKEMDFLSDDEMLLFNESYITDIALNKYYQKLCNDYLCKEEQFFTINKLNNILKQIENEIKSYAPKQVKLKIFRDVEIEKYEQSELNYLSSSLFAVEDKVLKLKDNNKLGQPYLDNTLSLDKPFMIHRTMKSEISFPKTKDEMLYIKYLDDYLSMNKGVFYLELEKFSTSQTPFINKEQFIIQKKKNYELFEFLPNYYDEFEKKPFIIKNYMKVKKNKKLLEDKNPFLKKYLLEKELDNLCNKKLIKNYFSNKIKGIDKELESLIFLIREPCFLYFKKSQINGKEFYSQIEKIVSFLILYQYKQSDEKQIRQKVLENLNLKLSMQQYFKGVVMDIKNELELLSQRVSSKDYKPLNKKEFLLLSGQVAYYLISQSESNNRTFRLAEHYLKSKHIKTVKEHIRNDLERYKHKIYLTTNKSKFKNALALLIAFDENSKLSYQDMDLFLIGLVSENIF